jgi:hypothetical protein
MSGDDDFEKADADAGVALVVPEPVKDDKSIVPHEAESDVVAFRNKLVAQYHKGAPSLVKRLQSVGRADAEALLVALIDEVIGETDHLLGNELVSTHNGELRDASVISFKRAEVLEKAIKAVQAKQEFERDSGFDIDSPAMMVIFRFFMAKCKDSFDKMGVREEVPDLFFRTLGELMDEWKKELRENFEELRNKR